MNNKETIGMRITKARQKKSLDKSQLSKMLAVSKNTISMYESGARTPSIEVIISLSRVLHVSTDYLLLGKAGQVIDASGLEEDLYLAVSEIVMALNGKRK